MALKTVSACSALLLGALLVGCSSTDTPGATPDTVSPTVSLSSSANPVTTESFTLKADAKDDTGVTKVEFYEGTTKLGEDTTAPYELPLSVKAAQNGDHTYTATAYDAAGNKGSASIKVTIKIADTGTPPGETPDRTPPTVTLTSSANPVTTNTFTLKADAKDNVAVTKVEFYEGATKLGEDATAPYELPVTLPPLQNGKHTYTATAYDAAGNKASASLDVLVNVNAGIGPVQGTVVDQNIGAAVGGSTITVFQNGQRIGAVTSDAQGNFTLSGLSAGTYDLQARKPGMAGYDLHDVVIGTQPQTVRLIQRPAFDTAVTTDGAKLRITRADGSAIAGATFTNNLDFRIAVTDDSNHVGPMRAIYAQLGRTPGSGSVTSSTTASAYSYAPTQDQPRTADTGPVTTSGNFTAGFGSAAGETVYLEVVAVDYNYNYSHYVIPVRLINTAATTGNTVVAPTQAAATAFTLKQEGSWTTPYQVPGTEPSPDAAPNGSGIFVEVRWCYTNTSAAARPFAFDIERSSDGTTFTKVGTVGGGTPSASCSANQGLRPYSFRDNSAELSAGKTFTYRVKARGTNTADSNVTRTMPLAQFQPRFIAPADETTGVSLTPTFVLGQNQTEIGADGTAYNLQVRDLMTLNGYNLPGAGGNTLIRVEEGTGEGGNGIAPGQALVFASTGSLLGAPTSSTTIWTDTSGKYAAARPNQMPVDTTEHTFRIPWNALVSAPLQPLRPYKWEMYSGIAYKYAPTEDNRISAYSVYTWAADSSGLPVAPINQTRPVNINWDFITGPQ